MEWNFLKLIASLIIACLLIADRGSFANEETQKYRLNTAFSPIANPSISAIRGPDGQSLYLVCNGYFTSIRVSDKVSDKIPEGALGSCAIEPLNYKWPAEVYQDFQAELGGNYIIKRWGAVCTLPSAIGNCGKCVTVQNQLHNNNIFGQNTFFKTTKGEHIYAFDTRYESAGKDPVWVDLPEWHKQFQHYYFLLDGTFISNGEDWYRLLPQLQLRTI